MAETVQGKVRAVTEKPIGSELAIDIPLAQPFFPVADAYPFSVGCQVSLGGALYTVTSIDDDTDTLNITPGATVAASAGDRVDLWDADNGRRAMTYEALVMLDGQDDGDPIPAFVDERDLGYLAQAIRAGAGESVTLERVGARYRVKGTHGKAASLESTLVLGAGGLTTRSDGTGAGTDLDSTGVIVRDADGNQIIRIGAPRDGVDVLDEGGFFVYQLSGRIVAQFNTGTNRDQPSIQADPSGTGANLMLFSGASTLGRESWVLINQGNITLGIENSPDSGVAGSQFILSRTDIDGITEGGARVLANADTLLTQSEYHNIGGTTMASIVYGNDGSYTAGYRTSDGGHIEGLVVLPGGYTQVRTAGSAVQITTAGGGSLQDFACHDATVHDLNYTGTLNPVSDEAAKTDVTDAPDALAIIAAAPSRQWRYIWDEDGTVRFGPMAQALASTGITRPVSANGQEYLSYDLGSALGLAWKAIDQLREQNAQLSQQVADLTARLDAKGT